MNAPDVKAAIASVLHGIAPEVDLNSIAPDQNFQEATDIDSFDFLNLLVGLHQELGVDIPESDYGKLRSLNDLLSYLGARTQR